MPNTVTMDIALVLGLNEVDVSNYKTIYITSKLTPLRKDQCSSEGSGY